MNPFQKNFKLLFHLVFTHTVMKKGIILLTLMVISHTSFSQIVLKQSYTYSATITKINETTYKYFLMDVPNAQCRIYNLDFSLYKTINLPTITDEWVYDIRFVSEGLFNIDTKIELLYTTYRWITVNTQTGDGYYIYHSYIINEDGVELLDVPGALYSYVHETSPGENSLFLYIYDMSVDPYSIQTNIYSVPGTYENIIGAKKSDLQLSLNPNPARDLIQVKYTLPVNVPAARLLFVDSQGKQKKVIHLDNQSNTLNIDREELLSGIYFVFLESNGARSETKKLILQ